MSLIPSVSKNDHINGDNGAAIELVEYGDYQCSHCGEAQPLVKSIQKELRGQLKFVFRNFPLRKVHPDAMEAAIASEAADLQGKYWEMHDILFENQQKLDRLSILHYASALALDPERFRADAASPELEKKVLADFNSGLRSGVHATPTFFVNGEKYEGDWRSREFHFFLTNLL
jgi:protein-disulfide isomerase